MYIRTKNQNDYLIKVKVEFGKDLGLENDQDAYIELKELNTLEFVKLKNAYEKDELALLEYFKNILHTIIVNHNLYENENEKMKNQDVAELIFEKSSITVKVISTYTKAVFFTSKKETN